MQITSATALRCRDPRSRHMDFSSSSTRSSTSSKSKNTPMPTQMMLTDELIAVLLSSNSAMPK
eukprot:11176550-Heterocapsa_arctica.AAC.1